MIKFFTFLTVFIVAARAALDPEYVKKAIEDIQQVGRNCVKEVGATSEDFLELMAYKFPPSRHEGKCVISCFYKHFKIMKDDGSIDLPAAKAAFDDIKSMDEEIHGKIMKIVDNCGEKVQEVEDHCETASAIAVCVVEESNKVGLSKEAFLA